MRDVPNESVEQLLVGIDVVGQMLDMSRSSIYKILASGQLASVKVGARRLVKTIDLLAYVAGLEDRSQKVVGAGGEASSHTTPINKLRPRIAQHHRGEISQCDGGALSGPDATTPESKDGGQ